MARYLRDYRVDFVIDGKTNRTLTYSTENTNNPLHIQFSCSIEQGPSRLNLQIFNISPESRRLLQSEDIKVRLQVGFREDHRPNVVNLKTMFIGSVDPTSSVTTNSVQADHVTSITATEGYIIREVKLNISAGEGSTHTQIIKDIVNQVIKKSGGMLTADFSDLDSLNISAVYAKGTSVVGVADKVLTDRLKMHDLIYTISKGVLRVHRLGVDLRSRVHEVSLDTGLLSTPKPTSISQGQALSDPKSTKAYSFTSLLNPELAPLERVSLRHKDLEKDIELVVDSVVHSGGYEANQWYTKVNAHFEYTVDTNKSIATASQKKGQSEIDYFKIFNNL